MLVPDERRWNHNLHYHSLVVDAVPPGCARALDVGCGEGSLTRRLRMVVPEVIGIDLHPESIALARSHPAAGAIEYLVGDVLSYPLEPCSFDMVTAVASLHHMDATVWPPPETYRGMRRVAQRALPGALYRRHLLWRYSIVWTKPFDAASPD